MEGRESRLPQILLHSQVGKLTWATHPMSSKVVLHIHVACLRRLLLDEQDEHDGLSIQRLDHHEV